MGKMTKEILPKLKYVLISILLLISNPISGQELSVSLISDSISYDKISGNLDAVGNVKVFNGNTTLYADKINYDTNTDKLTIVGKFTITDGSNTITSNNDALIDTKLKNGLIIGARAIINEKLQISAKSLDRKNKNLNVYDKVIASSCKICKKNTTPIWQIRANRIVHNKEIQKILLKNAKLDLFGIPVLYVPSLSFPEPGVSRASGILVPKFSTSDKLGFSSKIPYYIVLDKSKDVTITPFIMSKNNFILETEYRQHTKNGYFELKNAFLLKDNLNQGRLNGFLEGKGSFDLINNYKADFNIDLANTINFASGERPFKNNFDYAVPGDDRLKNTFDISKTTSNNFFRLSTAFTQSFRYKDFNLDGIKEEDPDVPVVLPEMYFKKKYKNNIYGGKYTLTAHSINLENVSTGQYTRIGGKLDWKRNWKTTSGFDYNFLAQLNANTYLIENDFKRNVLPLGMIEARYPLKKSSAKVSHMFEPIAQVIFSPDRSTGYINNNMNTSDSTTAEFEETNLFSINRFPGFDEIESGMRANIGGKYIIYEPNGWEFTTTAGRVFRQKDLSQFDTSKSAGLNKLNSDYVSAFSLRSQKNFKITTRLLLDDTMNTSKNETKLNFSTTKYTTDIGYVWLDKQSVLNLDNQQHELNISTSYLINQNWKFGADWRQNINTHSPIGGNFDVMFENDCAKLNFLLDIKYDEQDRIDRTFGIQLFLLGLGSDSNKKKFNNRCRS